MSTPAGGRHRRRRGDRPACATTSQAGWAVTVLDGRFGAGCSHGNCGFVCPSHVLPLAEPGGLWSDSGRCSEGLAVAIKSEPRRLLLVLALPVPRRCNARHAQAGRAIRAARVVARRSTEELMANEDDGLRVGDVGPALPLLTGSWSTTPRRTASWITSTGRPAADGDDADGLRAGPEAGPGWRLALPERRPPAAGPAHASLGDAESAAA